jgi:pimeloyl-ACP methyl ester carboxylesterase
MIRRTLLKGVTVFGAVIATPAARAMMCEERESTLEYSLINVKGKSIAYKAGGNGVPIVMLHGWPQSSHVWHKVVPFLAAKHRVVLIDLPGLGESQNFDVFDTGGVADIISDATEALGISAYHLVGHDIGAWVATSLALRHEDRLKSLTVVDAGIPGLIPDEIFKPSNASRVWQFYFHAVGDIPELLTEGREREYLSWYFRNKAIVKDAISESDIDLYTSQYRRKHAMSNGFGYYRAFTQSADQNRSFRQKIAIPVLAIGGESAVGASIGAAMNKIATTVSTKVISNCGHYVPEERPTEFAETLLEFLDGRNMG